MSKSQNTKAKSAINNPDTGTTDGGADDVHGNVDAKEASPPKNLAFANGKRLAEVTNTANHINAASAGKRSASQSLHISDQEVDEAYDEEPLAVANNLDERQEELFAARLANSQSIVLTLRVRVFPHEGHDCLLFLDQMMDPRPLTGGHTSMGAYERHIIKDASIHQEHRGRQEFTRLRKKSETKGGLHPVWGFPSVQPENTSSVAQAEPCSVKELQADAQLEFILIQQDLRVLFAHLVANRQLVTEMEVLKSST
ncbi:ATP-binding cassette (ABC) Superfamily [Phytophthora palmivora]|uniref:ATP-binding cassette (ABC) Superfamily n=1 Tax=Phytophthora palmivora TaxID=4796 RepID=A0A2P4Y9P7_9STRA|nr:ATP-binding cassette (ABC) Superfamily [Phytophthora palmivora]